MDSSGWSFLSLLSCDPAVTSSHPKCYILLNSLNMEELIKNRHSVRKYKDIPLKDEDIIKINNLIEEIKN